MAVERERVRFGDANDETCGFEVIHVRSGQPGPTLALVAGVHGCEYTAMEALRRFMAIIAVGHLRRGQIVAVPLADEAAFEARRAFVNPVDELNLARQFPGRADGSHTQRLAAALMNAWDQADLVVDLHSGDLGEALTPFAIFHAGTAGDELARRAARCFPFPYRIAQPSDVPIKGSTSHALATAGRAGLIVEAGGDGQIDDAGATLVEEGLWNLLRALEMMEEEPVPTDAARVAQVECTSMVNVTLAQQGWWDCQVAPGQRVEFGDRLGTLTSRDGLDTFPVTSTATGILLYVMTSPAARIGDVAAGIGLTS